MLKESLELTIRSVKEQYNLSAEEVEQQLISFLNKKYLYESLELLQEALVQQAKELIVSRLYNSTSCEISQGWNNYSTIPSYKTLLWIMLSPAQHLYFDQIIDELLTEELIYTKTYTGDKEPKVVGLTEKGILYKAAVDLL